MPDWYDRLIHVLGLDAHRTDRITGVTLATFPRIETPVDRQGIHTSLCQTDDGARQVVFELATGGSHWIGFLRCTPGNLDCLEQFLTHASMELPPGESTDPVSRGAGWKTFLNTRPVLTSVSRWPDPHPLSNIALELLGPDRTGPHLRFIIRGSRGHLRRDLRWNRTLADQWQGILQAARQPG